MKYRPICILVSVSAVKNEIMVLNGTFKELSVIDCFTKWLFLMDY
jgi:hypothetical protein